MRIFSFYGDVPQLNRYDELRLSIVWRARWNAAGWTPFILGEHDARKHPMFDEFCAATINLPTVNPKLYEHFCRLRWLALAQAGGGWMSDLDVMPVPSKFVTLVDLSGYTTKFFTDHLKTGEQMAKLQILQVPCCPSLVYCSKENAERLCREFMAGRGRKAQDGRDHVSDQYCLESLIEEKADWVERRDVVKEYADVGWESAPILHFPNKIAVANGLSPRWKHIPRILD